MTKGQGNMVIGLLFWVVASIAPISIESKVIAVVLGVVFIIWGEVVCVCGLCAKKGETE